MGGQVVDKEQPYSTNKIDVIGNIVPSKIEINEAKNYAKFLVIIGNRVKDGQEDKEPEFYNFIHSIKEKEDKTLNSLKEMKEQGVGKQVKVKGSISYAKHINEQTGEVNYYNNFNAYSVEPTPNFLMPKATIELTGTVNNKFTTKDVGSINPETGKTKQIGYLSVKTMEGKEGQIQKYHNILTSNFTLSKNSDFLSKIQEGETISLKARLSGKGNILLAKDSQVFKGKDFATCMCDKVNNTKEVDRGK